MNEQRQEAYLQFLMEVLQATAESNGDAKVIYPLLQANTDKLDNIFIYTLRRWATSQFEKAQADDAESMAVGIGNFGNLILEFPLGYKASNMEIAIASYEIILKVFIRETFPQKWATTQNNLANAYKSRIVGKWSENIETAIESYNAVLQIYTRQAFPQQWATTQNNLAVAYSQRIVGDRGGNIEKAISLYNAVLQVYTRQAFPQQWATTQNNLATAYRDRILGEPSENIEKAIDSYNAALQVYTRQAFPHQWATAKNNLAIAYSERILGDRSENIEKAISFYNAVLQVYTQQAFPQQWAMTQNNLGNAYSDRIVGEPSENIEKAIESYNNALRVRTRQAFPQKWAQTQNNLATAYKNRIVGDREGNIEKAISFYNAILQVYTRQAFPLDWAMTQHNLANAYKNRIVGKPSENIEKAIESYNNALQVYTRQAFPQDWAMTQNNLANAYSERIVGEPSENIEKAISFYNAVLQVYTRQAFPQQWAMTQNNLGNAYSERIVGEPSENIEKAIESYNNALQVRTRQTFPQDHAETLLNLGILYQDAGRLTSAYNTYESAIATVELLRGEIVSGEEIKRKQAEKWNQLYRRMVEVCLKLEEHTQAVEYVERSKTRNLVELLFNDELYPKGEVPPEVRQQLQQLRREIETEKQRLQQAEKINANNLDLSRTHLNQLRQQREDLISRVIGFKPIRFPEIQNLLDENTAIIEWYIFRDCFRVFVITRNHHQPKIWCSSTENLDKLVDWSDDEYLQPYSQDKKRWRHELEDKLPQLAEILHLDEVISLVPKNCQKLILVPNLFLHLLPIHALQLSNGEYLIDKFTDGVSYAPSCQLLRIAQQQLSHCRDTSCRASNLFAIQNPTNDLEFTETEVETIATKFKPSHILKHSQATETALKQQPNADNLKNANWLHFSCHAYFNWLSPLQSGLQLANSLAFPSSTDTESSCFLKLPNDTAIDLEKCLTLEDIFELNLANCRLVTLSACGSGLVDFTNTSDEYIGLPSGFIRAGAASIVSSLWAADDFSTAILMIKFYENIENLTTNISIALNQTQKWLRQVNQQDLLRWVDDNQNMTTEHKEKIKNRLEQNYTPEKQPFKNPYFWAAFCAVGE